MELSPSTESQSNLTQKENLNQLEKSNSRKLLGITIYFVVLLGIHLGYKIWLFITNLALLTAIYEPTSPNGSMEPLTEAILTTIPGLVPVLLYLVLLPGSIGVKLYDLFNNVQRGPRRQLVLMTIILAFGGLCLTIQVVVYIFRSTLQYLEQIPLSIECVCHLSNTSVSMIPNELHIFICKCYIPGLGPEKVFTTNPDNLTLESFKEIGLSSMYNTERSIDVTLGLDLMGSYYRMLPHMKRVSFLVIIEMTSLLQVYVVLVALKLPLYLLINSFQEEQSDKDEEPEAVGTHESGDAISLQEGEESGGNRMPRSNSRNRNSYAKIDELQRLTTQLKRLSTMRHTLFSPFTFRAESDLPEEPLVIPESRQSIQANTETNELESSGASSVLKFMFPMFSGHPASTATPVTDAELQETRLLVQKLKNNVMVTFAIEICYHGFVELVDAYSLCDEIVKYPDYFNSNIALTYGILTCLATALFVFTVGNFFVTHPGKSLAVNKLIKAALLTVSNLPAFIIRCYIFWDFGTMESMAGQIGSVFLLFTIKEFAVLILGVAELISVWKNEFHSIQI